MSKSIPARGGGPQDQGLAETSKCGEGNVKRGEEGNDRVVNELLGRVCMVIRGYVRAGSLAIPTPNSP